MSESSLEDRVNEMENKVGRSVSLNELTLKERVDNLEKKIKRLTPELITRMMEKTIAEIEKETDQQRLDTLHERLQGYFWLGIEFNKRR